MKYFFFYTVFLLIFGLWFAPVALGAEGQSLSVTPPLFQMNALPGDLWQSSIKVVNSNPYPLTVYAEVVNFKAVGESGQGRFIPILDTADSDNVTLAEWINISKGPYIIPPEQSGNISFFVEIPKNASPGGHYAAVLISTEPPDTGENLSVKTSQAVTSLFFVRIEGDVEEVGIIREFRVVDSLLETPEAEFSLRFENKGNVHLQPRGNIVITNMWGTERGTIPINYQTHFGNVLPESIRDFMFTWKSEFSLSDIGRYTAEVMLVYGEDEIKTVTSTTHFWIIPIKGTLITLLILVTFIMAIVYMVRAYIRRMLALAGVDVSKVPKDAKSQQQEVLLSVPRTKKSYARVSAPLRSGVLDLRKRLSSVDENIGVFKTVLNFVMSYKIFFISLCMIILIFVTTVMYFSKATDETQDYQVIIDEGDSEKVLQGSEIKGE